MGQADSLKNEIINLKLSLKSIIQDIQNCPGPMEELNCLNAKGREKISEIQACIELLKDLASDEIKSEIKQSALSDVNNISNELSYTVSVFKKATVACMLHIEKRARSDLLSMNGDSLSRHRKNKDKEDLVGMSSDVTDRLLSISRTLAETTQRSSDTLGTLVTSSGLAEGTREELDSQGNVISQSGKLLAKYGRREQTDKFLILFATAFFFACVAYVLHKRLF